MLLFHEMNRKPFRISLRNEVYAHNRVMDILGVYDYNEALVQDIPELPETILQGIFEYLEELNVEFDRATLGEKLMDDASKI